MKKVVDKSFAGCVANGTCLWPETLYASDGRYTGPDYDMQFCGRERHTEAYCEWHACKGKPMFWGKEQDLTNDD